MLRCASFLSRQPSGGRRAIGTAVWLAALVFPACAAAQQVQDLHPRHAVAGKEMLFTAEGRGLPPESSASARLTLSTVPENACGQARRFKPSTAEHYYFACTFGATATPVVVRIHQRQGQKTTLLASYTLPVLAGPPQLAQVIISGNVSGRQAHVRCSSGPPCVTVSSDLESSDTVQVEVRGQNLPPDLRLEVQGCARTREPPVADPAERRQILCTLARDSSGAQAVRQVSVLDAPAAQGGRPLWTTQVNMAALPQ